MVSKPKFGLGPCLQVFSPDFFSLLLPLTSIIIPTATPCCSLFAIAILHCCFWPAIVLFCCISSLLAAIVLPLTVEAAYPCQPPLNVTTVLCNLHQLLLFVHRRCKASAAVLCHQLLLLFCAQACGVRWFYAQMLSSSRGCNLRVQVVLNTALFHRFLALLSTSGGLLTLFQCRFKFRSSLGCLLW